MTPTSTPRSLRCRRRSCVWLGPKSTPANVNWSTASGSIGLCGRGAYRWTVRANAWASSPQGCGSWTLERIIVLSWSSPLFLLHRSSHGISWPSVTPSQSAFLGHDVLYNRIGRYASPHVYTFSVFISFTFPFLPFLLLNELCLSIIYLCEHLVQKRMIQNEN